MGAVLSLLFIRPKTRREAAERGCGSALFSFGFGDQLHHILSVFSWTSAFWQIDKPEHQVSAHILAALIAWATLSALMATLDVIEIQVIGRAKGWIEKWKAPPPGPPPGPMP